MADDCWGAFGSDSDDSDDDVHPNHESGQPDPFEPAADATALAITQQFVSLTKSCGVSFKERVVGVGGGVCGGEKMEMWQEMMMERVGGRGMKVVGGNMSEVFQCDAAILLIQKDQLDGSKAIAHSCLKRALVPGGNLWLMILLGENDTRDDASIQKSLKDYSEAIWDVDAASEVYSSPDIRVISVQKRACVVNAWSCPWMDKGQKIRSQLPMLNANDEFPISENETYLQYERKVASAVTVSPSVAERTRKKIDASNSSEESVFATVLTDANIQKAKSIMREHGFVVIKSLLPPSQTIQWGQAVLDDFETAVARLKCHPTRPVDLMNPHTADDAEEGGFEPLSYKEMAMREDLRVDLRSGPVMESLRCVQNDSAYQSMGHDINPNMNEGPSMINADINGTETSWRFHPSILAILKAIFNPRIDSLFKGNFGRWNFGGAGPDGSPQPFRLGQIGSVMSCPGSGDQAIHADTPHLFEHVDCLPCHYCNVFTPGYNVVDEPNNECFRNEFDSDGLWTGNSTIGGTAVVHGSHKLSVTTQLLSEDDADVGMNQSDTSDNATLRRQLLQLRTLRPALEPGDALIFDCRAIHYGLANTSQGDTTGNDINAGRRPMLYLNVSQSWFHDPKNWDDREKIFD